VKHFKFRDEVRKIQNFWWCDGRKHFHNVTIEIKFNVYFNFYVMEGFFLVACLSEIFSLFCDSSTFSAQPQESFLLPHSLEKVFLSD